MKTPLVLALCLLFFDIAFSQSRIALVNPSFELGSAGMGLTPKGWINLGEKKYTPPDIQPGSFGVTRQAAHGFLYLGMVTREDGSYESIGQNLNQALKPGSQYLFSVSLGYSLVYATTPYELVHYETPAQFRIIGVDTISGESEILAECDVTSNFQWSNYTFTLAPKKAEVNRIQFDAFFKDPKVPQNGHLLLDNCSDIVELSDLDNSLKPGKIVGSGHSDNTPISTPEEIFLQNPSFEPSGNHGLGLTWEKFHDCFFLDINLEPGVLVSRSQLEPVNGKTALTLLTSQFSEYQAVAQKLALPLKKLKTYEFSLSVNRRKQLKLEKKSTNQPQTTTKINRDFGKFPTKLEIWGFNTQNQNLEKLDETDWIKPNAWLRHTFVFTPITDDFDVLVLKPFITTEIQMQRAQGHVLIDNCSSIKLVKY